MLVLRVNEFDVDGGSACVLGVVCVFVLCACDRAPQTAALFPVRIAAVVICVAVCRAMLGPSQRAAGPRPSHHAERVLLHGGDNRLRHRGAVGASRTDLQVSSCTTPTRIVAVPAEDENKIGEKRRAKTSGKAQE